MLESILLGSYAFWLLLGLFLLASEFFTPGLIAVFFGIGALTVGVLTLFGVIEGLAFQLLCFAAISLGSLLSLRRHFKRWMVGAEVDRSTGDQDDVGFIGARVKVISDFEQGIGHVLLNGAKWDAESDEPLKAGDSAWVASHEGILLRVTARQLRATH